MTPYEIATTVILALALVLLGWMEFLNRRYLRHLDEKSRKRGRRP